MSKETETAILARTQSSEKGLKTKEEQLEDLRLINVSLKTELATKTENEKRTLGRIQDLTIELATKEEKAGGAQARAKSFETKLKAKEKAAHEQAAKNSTRESQTTARIKSWEAGLEIEKNTANTRVAMADTKVKIAESRVEELKRCLAAVNNPANTTSEGRKLSEAEPEDRKPDDGFGEAAAVAPEVTSIPSFQLPVIQDHVPSHREPSDIADQAPSIATAEPFSPYEGASTIVRLPATSSIPVVSDLNS